MARRGKKSNPLMFAGLALGAAGLYFLLGEKSANAAPVAPPAPGLTPPPTPTISPVTPPPPPPPPKTAPSAPGWKPASWYKYRDSNEILWTIKNVSEYAWEGRPDTTNTSYYRSLVGARAQDVEQQIDAYASYAAGALADSLGIGS